MSHSNPDELLSQARSGHAQALGDLLERYRPALRSQAVQQLSARLSTRVDESDIVQETFLEAHRDFHGFQGTCEAEWVGWLNSILAHNVAEAVRRHIQVGKRSVRVERSIDQTNANGMKISDDLANNQSSANGQALLAEDLAAINSSIEGLSADQREVIRLRYGEGLSVSQLSEHFGRSETAVASLLYRAMVQLRGRMTNGHHAPDK